MDHNMLVRIGSMNLANPIMVASGTFGDGYAELIDIDSLVGQVRHLIPPQFTAGETVLTVGSTVSELLEHVSGVISIGPFGCMPGRVGEAILSESLNDEKRKGSGKDPWIGELMERHPSLPFLCLESDGNPFPQIIEAKLELFCLQVLRVHETSRSIVRRQAVHE